MMNSWGVFGIACLSFVVGTFVGIGMMCMLAISVKGREK